MSTQQTPGHPSADSTSPPEPGLAIGAWPDSPEGSGSTTSIGGDPILRAVASARRRLAAAHLFRRVVFVAAVGVVACILLRVIDQVLGLGVPERLGWGAIAGWTAGACALAAVLWTVLTLPHRAAVARELDHRGDLRDALSTAWVWVQPVKAGSPQPRGPWADLVVDDAARRARALDVRRLVPIRPPGQWFVPPALGLGLLVVWMLPINFDLLGHRARAQEQAQNRVEIQEVKSAVQENKLKLQELLDRAKIEAPAADDGTDKTAPESQLTTPDDIRRTAVRDLTALQERLEEIKQSDKAEQSRAMEKNLRQMRSPGPGPMEEFGKALQKGDFGAARQQLMEIEQKARSQEMSPQDRVKAAEQLQKMSEQLERLSKDRESIQKTLEQAGMSPQEAKAAASDPQALKQAMEKLSNLPPQQREALIKELAAAAKACDQAGKLGEKMGQAAKSMGEQGQMGQGGQEMEGALSDMEMAAAELKSLEAASSEARRQLASLAEGMSDRPGRGKGKNDFGPTGKFREGETDKPGKGSGGPGKGRGVGPEGSDVETTTEQVRSQSKSTQGPIIGTRLVFGQLAQGTSRVEASAAVEASSKAASAAMESMAVQREFQDAVKHYFGRLEAKMGAAAPSQSGAPESGAPEKKGSP